MLVVYLAQTDVAPITIGIPVATWAAGLLLLATLGGRILRGQGRRIEAIEKDNAELRHQTRWMRYKIDWLAPKAVHNGVVIPPAFYREPKADESFPDLDRQS